MGTMVAEFCSLVILIHNTLLGEVMISSTSTTRVKILYLYSPVCNDMQRFKVIDFMVFEVCFFKEKNKKMKKNRTKCGKHFFRYYVYLTSDYYQILYTVVFHMLS